jgi:hypothetical protein
MGCERGVALGYAGYGHPQGTSCKGTEKGTVLFTEKLIDHFVDYLPFGFPFS